MTCNLRIRLFISTIVLSSAGLMSLPADEKLDPAGLRGIRTAMPGRPNNEATLRLGKAGDKLVGVMTDVRGRSTPIKDPELKDGELSFRLVFKQQDREFSFLYKGK